MLRFVRAAVTCCAATAVAGMVNGTILADGTTGSIHGQVYVQGSRLPVCCLVVRVLSDREPPQETRTRPDGSFSFAAVFPGTVAITIGERATPVEVHANLESDETIFMTNDHAVRSR